MQICNVFNLSLDFVRPCNQEVLWLYRRKLFIVQNQHAKFGSHSHYVNGDIAYLLCHVNLQDHMIKGSSDFMEGGSSLYVTTLLDLVAIRNQAVEICFNLSRPHVTTCSKSWNSPQVLLQYRYNKSNISHDLARP